MGPGRVFTVGGETSPQCGYVQLILCEKALTYERGGTRCRPTGYEYEDHEKGNCDKHGKEWRQEGVKAARAELERLILAAPTEEAGAEAKQLKVAALGEEGVEDGPQESECGDSWYFLHNCVFCSCV